MVQIIILTLTMIDEKETLYELQAFRVCFKFEHMLSELLNFWIIFKKLELLILKLESMNLLYLPFKLCTLAQKVPHNEVSVNQIIYAFELLHWIGKPGLLTIYIPWRDSDFPNSTKSWRTT